jgi:hypothetical protein
VGVVEGLVGWVEAVDDALVERVGGRGGHVGWWLWQLFDAAPDVVTLFVF